MQATGEEPGEMRWIRAAALGAALAAAGGPGGAPAVWAQSPGDGVETVQTARIEAEVVSVDREAGEITLRNPSTGDEWVRRPPGGITDQVRLEAGDLVTALRTRAVTAYPAPPEAEPGPVVDGFTTLGEREGKWALIIGRLSTQIYTLVTWDAETGVVTGRPLGGGDDEAFAVRSDEGRAFLNAHPPGDRLVVEISETIVLIKEN